MWYKWNLPTSFGMTLLHWDNLVSSSVPVKEPWRLCKIGSHENNATCIAGARKKAHQDHVDICGTYCAWWEHSCLTIQCTRRCSRIERPRGSCYDHTHAMHVNELKWRLSGEFICKRFFFIVFAFIISYVMFVIVKHVIKGMMQVDDAAEMMLHGLYHCDASMTSHDLNIHCHVTQWVMNI